MKTLLTATALVAFAMMGSAGAADLAGAPVYKAPIAAPAPAYDWTGPTIGVNAGYGWNHDSGALECISDAGVWFGVGCGLIPFKDLDSSGAFGGGQIGYNHQIGHYVLGIQTDFQLADISGSTSINGPWPFVGVPQRNIPNSVFTASQKIDWFATTRLRLGYAAVYRTLIYATGGFAYGRAELQTAVTFPTNSFPASAAVTKIGWAIGGGIEHALSDHLSAALESLYYNLGDDSIYNLGDDSISAGSVPPITATIRGKEFETRVAVVRAALNYKFDWGAPVAAKY